jgi:hypothetical protein
LFAMGLAEQTAVKARKAERGRNERDMATR